MTRLQDILGQAGAVEWLQRSIKADRLPHGLIFAGPRGVGKGTTAAALAALFLCDVGGDDACGQCAACKLMAAGTHPDYHFIYRQLIRLKYADRKARDLPIEVIRDYLLAPAALKSSLGRGKVFVIEEADLMNAQAQNGMLKTLEEPAGRTLILLLAEDPLTLLPTIRSRSQIVRFRPLEPALVQRELQKRGVLTADAASAAALTEGSLGQAIRWLEDGVIARARELGQRLQQVVGGGSVLELPEWFRVAADEYAGKQLERDELASKDQATREGLALYVTLAARFFSRKLAASADPAEQQRLCSAVEAATRASMYLDANVNITLIFHQFGVTLERLFVAASPLSA